MPKVVVIAGINGAGKTTASVKLLTGPLHVPTFVNADAIARGLNSLNPEGEAMRAGRLMLQHLNELVERRADFSFETTLAARTYPGWLGGLRALGYEVFLYYFWLASPELAIARVAARVRSGGHFIPDATIRQRYARSAGNFFELYRPVCDYWEAYDNTGPRPVLFAVGSANDEIIDDAARWVQVQRSAGRE